MEKLVIKGKTLGEGKTLVCVPVMESSIEAVVEEIKYLAKSDVDMIEWRVDAFGHFRDCNAVRAVFEQTAPFLSDKIFLYTFRSRQQGGLAEITPETLSDLQELAVESKCVDLVDMEFFAEKNPLRTLHKLHAMGMKVVASHHDFEETPTPQVMRMLLDRMCAGGADIVKLAVMPGNPQDVLNLLAVTEAFKEENPDTPAITMSMGKMGCISRLCGENFGSCVTFGAHKMASAPGQFEMNKLQDILTTIHESNQEI